MLSYTYKYIKNTRKQIIHFICLELVSAIIEQHTINTACTYFAV